MRLGVDELNFSINRFNPKRCPSPICPFCDQNETVSHFLCECKHYKELRDQLEQAFHDVYPRGDRDFNHIGLLGEPYGKQKTARHLPVIHALNQYITDAWESRKEGLEILEFFDELEGDQDS